MNNKLQQARPAQSHGLFGEGGQLMSDAVIGPCDHLPAGARLILTAEHVMRAKGTILVGRVECEELRVGDWVVAATDRPICRGVAVAIERFMQPLDVARRGDEVGALVRGWADFPVGPGTRLYLVPRSQGPEQSAAADFGDITDLHTQRLSRPQRH